MGDLLVVRPGAIGDSLLAVPALAALRAARPDDRITLVAHPAVGPLLERAGLVDRFIRRDAPEADALFAPSPRLAREYWRPVSVAVAWSADPEGLLAANLEALGARPTIVAPSRPADGSGKHVAEYLLETVAPLGVQSPLWPLSESRLITCLGSRVRSAGACPPPRPERPPAGAGDKPPRYGSRVVLHLGSGSPRKNWPPERFATLSDELGRELRTEPFVLAGPADDQALSAFSRAVSGPYRLLRERPLLELADLLANCALYVGNDSGISHLAGQCGAPTLTLFGPTEPRIWRPVGPWVEVLRFEPLELLEVSTVLRAALTVLGRGTY